MNKKARIWYWREYWENQVLDKIIRLAFVWENSRKKIVWLALKEPSFRARNPALSSLEAGIQTIYSWYNAEERFLRQKQAGNALICHGRRAETQALDPF